MKRFAMLAAAGAVAATFGCAEPAPTETQAPAAPPAVAAATPNDSTAQDASNSANDAATDADVRFVSLSVPNMV